MRRPGLTAVTAAGFVVCLALAPPPAQPLWSVLAGMAAVILELGAPYVLAAGFLSLAPAVYLGLACLPAVGAWSAAVIALVGLGTRSLWRGSRQSQVRWDEALSEAAPVALALGAACVAPAELAPIWRLGLSLTVYAVSMAVTLALSFHDGGARVRAMRLVQGLLVVAGSTLVLLLPGTPAVALAAAALVALPGVLAPRLSLALHTAGLLERERALAQRSLDSAGQRLELLSRAQKARSVELELFRRFASSFARQPDPLTTANSLMDEVNALVASDSLVVFVRRDTELDPLAFRSPAADRLANRALLELSEPLLEQCLDQGKPISKVPTSATGQELLPPEEYGLALPMETGVLYLGWRKTPSLASDALKALLSLVELGSVALGTALELEQVRRALDYHASSHSQARAWLERFDVLLGGVRSLAGPLSSDQVLETLREMAGRLVAHDRGAILVRLGERQGTAFWPREVEPAREPLEHFAQAVITAGRPLMLEHLQGSQFEPVWTRGGPYLAAPIVADGAALGVILLGRLQGAFERQEQESLCLAAVQTAIMLDKCRLYQEVVDSKARLERSQAQLVQSSKLAAVGQLAAGVAHELNTPLGAALLRVDSALRSLDKDDPEGARRKLQVAREAALSARDIVANLLAYSREDVRQMVRCELADVVQKALVLVDAQLRQQQVAVRCQHDGPAVVLGHPSQLVQLVINLLLNARDAIAAAGPQGQVQVRTRVLDDHVLLEVEDSGPGVPDEARERLFDPFFTTKPVGAGTGLGLWVSYQIAEAHGGTLSLAQGLPTRFVLALPAPTGGSATV